MGWQNDLIAWFQATGRDLPWRRSPTPYQVWLSEVMLQQTQVDRVVAYFQRWLDVLPTLESVAEADEESILALWRGLGYYSRARNFHKAVQIVVEEFSGQVPTDRKALLSLPGIGPYTASAIRAFAFNEPEATVEANTERVYARLFDVEEPIKSAAVQRRMAEHIKELIPRGRARLFDTALMELGSLVCTPSSPNCSACPIRSVCQALGHRTVAQRPVLPERPKRVRVKAVALLVVDHGPTGEMSVWLRRRPPNGLWGGFWELPWEILTPNTEPETAARALCHVLPGTSRHTPQPLGVVRGSFTKHQLQMACYLVEAPQLRVPPPRHQRELRLSPPWQWKGLAAGEVPARAAPLVPVSLEQALSRPLPAFHLRALRLLAPQLSSSRGAS